MLQADLGDLCQNKVACNIFLHLLAPSNRAYLPPHVSALLVPRPAVAVSAKSAPETPAAASDVLEVVTAPTSVWTKSCAICFKSVCRFCSPFLKRSLLLFTDTEVCIELLQEVAATVAAPVSSKKDAVLRRQELLSSGKGSLAAELTLVCASNATKLLLNPKGCDLLVEAACGSEGGMHYHTFLPSLWWSSTHSAI